MTTKANGSQSLRDACSAREVRGWLDEIVTLRLGVVGDIHGHWTPADTSWFNASDLHALLLVGDLPSARTHHDLFDVAHALSELTLPTMLIPGNHDGPPPLAVLAEALGLFRDRSSHVQATGAAVDRLERALGEVAMVGYSRHTVESGDVAIDVVAGRPHAMDSRHLTFAGHLSHRYGVTDHATSSDKLYALVQECTNPILFLAHNGPWGLGAAKTDPWALSRFKRDNGDPDLQDAIARARNAGHRVIGVVAGHMHHRGIGHRRWQVERDDVVYINAARVPRVFRRDGQRFHHHVRLEFDGETLTSRAVLTRHD